MSKILLINGPNLDLLGKRELDIYGDITLDEIETTLKEICNKAGDNITCVQSNAEHEILDSIHRSKDEEYDIIIFNPAAFTHTSVAIRDALLAIQIPFIEVHISNINKREDFRKKSFFSDIAIGTIAGFGMASYEAALVAAKSYLKK